jgi:hypothetical protein
VHADINSGGTAGIFKAPPLLCCSEPDVRGMLLALHAALSTSINSGIAQSIRQQTRSNQ